MGYIADHHDKLMKEITDEHKEIFEKFTDCFSELNDINEREIFIYAFRLGMRIAIDVLCENKIYNVKAIKYGIINTERW